MPKKNISYASNYANKHNRYKLHLIFVTTRTLNPHYSNHQPYFMDEKWTLLTNLQK